jgi:hypothetical protein
LSEILTIAKNPKGLVAIQLDISKAFDTLPHQAIDDHPQMKRLPQTARNIILNSYKEINTTIEHGGAKIQISLRRGVKQGDHLSGENLEADGTTFFRWKMFFFGLLFVVSYTIRTRQYPEYATFTVNATIQKFYAWIKTQS